MKEKIREVALNHLTRRDHSARELTQKLRIKGYALQEIEIVIHDLVQSGFLNDGRFTENYIDWRRGKGYGPQRIFNELQVRGIADEVIAEHLEITDNAWFVEVRRVWQKHFKNQLPRDFKSKAKQMRFLQYRGFTQQQIESIFKDTDGHGNDD